MKLKASLFTVVLFMLAGVSQVTAQVDEVKLAAAMPKITTVSAMRARKAPQVSAEEITRLKLGTVVSAVARSANRDTAAGETGYWYRVNLPNGKPAWLFGGLLLDYNASQRDRLIKQIIADRLKVDEDRLPGEGFADRQEIYELAASSSANAKDANTRGEFELLKLLALRYSANAVPADQKEKSPYREWYRSHGALLVRNEFAGWYELRTDVLWNLQTKYHTLPVGERIAWEAAENPEPSECESDQVCNYFQSEGEIKYMRLYPRGAHVGQALENIALAMTDDVIATANSKGGNIYDVQQRTELRKSLANLRLVVAKVSAPQKAELVKKLGRVK